MGLRALPLTLSGLGTVGFALRLRTAADSARPGLTGQGGHRIHKLVDVGRSGQRVARRQHRGGVLSRRLRLCSPSLCSEGRGFSVYPDPPQQGRCLTPQGLLPQRKCPVLVPLGKVARWGEEEGMESPREESWPGNESDFTSKSRDEKKEITNGTFNILCVLE